MNKNDAGNVPNQTTEPARNNATELDPASPAADVNSYGRSTGPDAALPTQQTYLAPLTASSFLTRPLGNGLMCHDKSPAIPGVAVWFCSQINGQKIVRPGLATDRRRTLGAWEVRVLAAGLDDHGQWRVAAYWLPEDSVRVH